MKLRVVLVVFGLLAATIGIPAPVVAQASTWESAVAASSPSHWWKLNNTAPNAPAVDSAGSITATHNSNAIAVPGISGQAAQFGNGSATELLLDGTNTRFEQITAELWFKPDPVFVTDRQRLIRHRTHGYHIDWLPNLSAVSANVSLETPNGDEWDNIELVAVGIDPDEWHHVALSVDTTQISLWVDGNERDTFEFLPSNAVGVHYTNDLLTIGNDYPGPGSTRKFSGLLDEVVLYDRAIAGTEIQSHYTATGRTITPITATVNGSNYAAAIINSGPVAYWQLDDDTTATNVVDSIDPNANNAGISGQRPDFDQPGVFTDSTAISFNNKNEYLSLPGGLLTDLDTEFTVEMWLQSGSTSGWDRAIRARNHGFGIDWDGANQRFQAWLHTRSGDAFVYSHPVSLNQWNHVAFVFDGAEIRMVVNGELHDVTATPGNTVLYSGSTPALILGNDSPGNRKRDFNGSIDEVAIYNTALPTQEVRSHYGASGRLVPQPTPLDTVVSCYETADGATFFHEPTLIDGQALEGCYVYEDCISTIPTLSSSLEAYVVSTGLSALQVLGCEEQDELLSTLDALGQPWEYVIVDGLDHAGISVGALGTVITASPSAIPGVGPITWAGAAGALQLVGGTLIISGVAYNASVWISDLNAQAEAAIVEDIEVVDDIAENIPQQLDPDPGRDWVMKRTIATYCLREVGLAALGTALSVAFGPGGFTAGGTHACNLIPTLIPAGFWTTNGGTVKPTLPSTQQDANAMLNGAPVVLDWKEGDRHPNGWAITNCQNTGSYNPPADQCDEYPYASTIQGGSQNSGNSLAAAPVPAISNQGEGNLLSSFLPSAQCGLVKGARTNGHPDPNAGMYLVVPIPIAGLPSTYVCP